MLTNKDYLKKFYENLPEEKKTRICEECHQTFSYSNKTKHYKTKLHKILSQKLKEIEKNNNSI